MGRHLSRWVLSRLVLTGTVALIASPAFADRTKESEAVAAAPVAVQRVSGQPWGLRDEAAMVLVGTALIGLASAVRRAV